MRNKIAISRCVSLLLLCSACIQPLIGYHVSGSVVDEMGNPIENAAVTLASGNMDTMTDVNGAFTFAAPEPPTPSSSITVQASGYARSSRLLMGDNNNVIIVMRAPQMVTSTRLPNGKNKVATAHVSDGDGGATLTIPSNALIAPNGKPATGLVQIALTYWHPKKSLVSSPGALLTAGPGGTTLALESFGMVDIEVSQEGSLLQVANGTTLGLQFSVPKAQWLNLSARLKSSELQPNLYSLDMSTGLWKLEGTLANPNRLTFNASTGEFQTRLPHLSAWNMDGILPNEGGCVQGHAVNSAGAPAANTQVRVYFLDRDEVKDFVATTDGNGDYCANTGYTPPDNYAVEQVPYYVASADNVNNSKQCNPMPGYCSDCLFEPLYCSNCASRSAFVCADNGAELTQWGDNTCNALPVCNASSSLAELAGCGYKYLDSCGAKTPVVTINPCHFCGAAPGACGAIVATGTSATYEMMAGINGGCEQLGTVVLGGTPGSPPNPNTPSNTCPQLKSLGEACDPKAVPVCCATGLVCLDYLCVPPSDD